MKGEIIHKFQSTVNLAKLEEQGAQQAIFHLGVSLRGSEAMDVYEQFRKLTGLSLTNLAGFSMKVDDQARPPMTQQLARMTYSGGPGICSQHRLMQSTPAPPTRPRAQLPITPTLPLIIPPAPLPSTIPVTPHSLSSTFPTLTITVDNPDLQVLVNRWYQQEEAHALDSPAPWLFMQLPRSSRDEQGNITKTHKPIIIPKVLQLPVFESPHSLEPRWQPYHLIACILHHGPLLTSGHYSVLSIGGAQSHVLDDEKPRVPATNAFLESASCSAYVLMLALDMSDSSQSRLAQTEDSSDVGRERQWDESLLAEEIRGHMDSGTLKSYGVPAERARGADDADATTRRQHSVADAYASAACPSSLVLVQQQSYKQSSNDQSACPRHA